MIQAGEKHFLLYAVYLLSNVFELLHGINSSHCKYLVKNITTYSCDYSFHTIIAAIEPANTLLV